MSLQGDTEILIQRQNQPTDLFFLWFHTRRWRELVSFGGSSVCAFYRRNNKHKKIKSWFTFFCTTATTNCIINFTNSNTITTVHYHCYIYWYCTTSVLFSETSSITILSFLMPTIVWMFLNSCHQFINHHFHLLTYFCYHQINVFIKTDIKLPIPCILQ